MNQHKIDNLRILIESEGWKTLVNLIKDNDIKALQAQLEVLDSENISEFKSIQYRLRVMRELINMPEKIISSLTPQEKIENDPYPQTIEDVKRMGDKSGTRDE